MRLIKYAMASVCVWFRSLANCFERLANCCDISDDFDFGQPKPTKSLAKFSVSTDSLTSMVCLDWSRYPDASNFDTFFGLTVFTTVT